MARFEEDLYVAGNLAARTMAVPNGTLTDAGVAAAADIAASKLEHQHAIRYDQPDGTDVVAAIVPVHVVRGTTATVVAVEVVCVDAPSGGDKKFTVDLQKANAGSPAPATILTGVVDYVNATPDCTVLAGTIDSGALVDGDTLVVEVAVSGSTGAQGQGLAVVVTVREKAD